jgi:hypothetical protein
VSAALNPPLGTDWDRWQRRALAAAAAGVGLFVAAALVRYFAEGLHSPTQLFLSYLVAFNFWLSVPLGCLVLLMIQYLTGGMWGLLLRGVLQAGTRTLALLAVLFVPVAAGLFLGAASLYPWARPPDQVASGAALEELREKAAEWLNAPFFLCRAAVYFVCWLVVIYFLNRWAAEPDGAHGPSRKRRLPAVSGPGLVLYGVTITLASIDWSMSLEPNWYSTIYPVLYAVGQILTAFAFAVAVLALLARGPLAGVVRPQHLRDLGSLMLTFVMFWAYMTFSQFLLIWVGNLPEEIPWYLRRTRDGWQWVAVALAVLHFAVPFLLLLLRAVKEDGRWLALTAGWLLLVRFLDVFWWIEPAYPHDGQYLFWLLDVGAVVGVGGVWTWWFLGQLRRGPLLTVGASLTEGGNHA